MYALHRLWRQRGLGFSDSFFFFFLSFAFDSDRRRRRKPVSVREWWRPRVLGRPRCRMCVEAPREHPQNMIIYDYYIFDSVAYCGFLQVL